MQPYRERNLQSATQYLTETEPAIRNLFEDLEQYYAIIKEIRWPFFVAPLSSKRVHEVAFKKWQRNNRAALKRASEVQRKYLGYRFSVGTLCGSILQIAHVGIRYYSKNKAVSSELSPIIKPGSNLARFCIGRRVRKVPIGLIIYAARNQYAHWDDEDLTPVSKYVFNALATNHDMKGAERIKDPAFSLNNKIIQIYSSNVLAILDWKSYDAYLEDMKNLLASNEREGIDGNRP